MTRRRMPGFREWLRQQEQRAAERLALFEHNTYQRIPGTSQSYREDSANTNTKTDKHAHVYAKLNGGGKELYSVTVYGRGHDGSSGTQVPAKHADHFRSIGYAIPPTNILESLDIASLDPEIHSVIFMVD